MRTIFIALVCLFMIPAAYAAQGAQDARSRTAAPITVPQESALHGRSVSIQPPPAIRPAADQKAVVPSSGAPISAREKGVTVVVPQVVDVEQYYKTGIQEHHDQRYERAVGSLAHYVSLVPKSPRRTAVLLIIGKSMQEMNRTESALEIYGRIIEQYPDRLEALLSMIAMADIGAANPSLNYPIGKKGSEYVRDPMIAYEDVRMKKVPAPMIEHIQYQKGRFLWKTGRYIQSCTVQKALLKEFPDTAYRKEAINIIKNSTVFLFHRYNQLGDHVSAATLFLEARRDGIIGVEEIELTLQGAISLARLGLHDTARNILNSVPSGTGRTTASEIEKTKTEIEKARVIGAVEQPKIDKKWELFESVQAALRDNDPSLAEKTLSNLKEAGSEPFWSKITEYAIEENRWAKKNQNFLKKKDALNPR